MADVVASPTVARSPHAAYGLRSLQELGPTTETQIETIRALVAHERNGVTSIDVGTARRLHFLLWRLAWGRLDPDG